MSISEDLILAHADEFVLAAQEFRVVATERMYRLAEHFGVFFLEVSNHRFETNELPIPQVGIFDGDWRYAFHGFQCSFENLETGQSIDVELGYGDDFGVLDAWFFACFLESSPSQKFLLDLLPDVYSDVRQVLALLETKKRLIRVPGSPNFWCQQREPGLAAPPRFI